ncbi:SpoIIE family protein phosphatase [Leptospira sp. GIMC2001]|uniref:SpoIIE family protein phosphatase n=1 Tax=Leptospira sp. GIMC2001 TaxID=1513297 RepID=UPI00234B1116|nr:SpoIIE family protein phosphatase [Leptospira sp. GIMC2001]WCL48058.1 SpoIIE family protein phosphatase [Leptospira sp. GIMC2001]
MIPRLLSFICFAIVIISGIPILHAKESISVQNVLDLDSVVDLGGLEQDSNWYITKDRFSIETLEKNLPSNSSNTVEWRKYNPPSSLFNLYPDWAGNRNFTAVKLIHLPAKWEAPHISIRLGIISDRDKLYINGNYIGGMGEFGSEYPQAYDRIRIYKIPNSVLKPDSVNTILVELETFFEISGGMEQDRLEIGPSEILEKTFFRDEYVKLLLLMIYLTVGMYFLFLFLRRRKDSENLYFALFTFSLVIYQFLRNQMKYELGIDFYVMKKAEYLVLLLLIPLIFHFLRTFFQYKYHWFYKCTDLILFGVFVSISISSNVIFYDLVNRNVVQPVWVLYIIGTFYILIAKSIKKDLDAMLILGGFFFLVIAAILDVLSTRNIIVFPRMVGYAFIFLILSIAIILANRFVRLNSQVEELNANLEQKVVERTEQLNQTLGEVQKLKVQQDGDYFLTSLLLNPLITNQTVSDKINIEFFTQQKKTFEFKGKTHEIGGDISISSNLQLKGKQYTVFINGDAMGKSIQGAGGALVLGVVFNAVLTRSNSESNKNRHPETWIKETFIDLQRIYESFNGSMLVSIVLGLIEEDTGLLYYINAEHPWSVLYRDGKASFLENELVLRKLGFPGNDFNFFVKTFQLMPDDVIFVGSDGRDDILLGYDEEGHRIINEDENIFVDVVEKSRGDLSIIVKKLETMGQYTDDITLLRIAYSASDITHASESNSNFRTEIEQSKELIKKGKYEETISYLENQTGSNSTENETIASLLGQTYFKLKNWENAYSNLEIALDKKPSNTELLFYASYSAKMIGKFAKAMEYGERSYIREPNNTKNTVNLADIYIKLSQLSKAEFLIDRILAEDPENRNALILKNKLETKQV